VLKLVYHTVVFGPINLEYEKPVVRVGRSEDNDLVLLHPSVKPHHCLLVFEDEKLAVLPPDGAVDDVEKTGGHMHKLGDTLQIGALEFSLGHSARTVALPEARAEDSPALNGGAIPPGWPRLYCPHCQVFVPEGGVRRIGLVGRAQHLFCPQCSHPVEVQQKPPETSTRFWSRLRNLWRGLTSASAPSRPRHPGAERDVPRH
jgi:hypothetical protein